MIQTLAEIGRVFASDRYDLADDRGVPASRFMLWREEQRAMGELARDRDHDTVVGFATFAEKATGSGARWFANFVADLEAGGVAESQRLELVQSLLAKLVRSLDEAGSYLVDGNAPQWMQQAAPDPAAITAPRKQRR